MKKRTGEKKGAIKNSVGRITFTALLVLLQIIAIVLFIANLGVQYPILAMIIRGIALFIVIGINAIDHNSSIRLAWVIIILTVPVAGVILYLIAQFNPYLRTVKKKLEKIDEDIFPKIDTQDEVFEKLKAEAPDIASQVSYLRSKPFPVYENTDIRYYDSAESAFEAQLHDMEKAEKYIYMEYHAVANSKYFEPLHDVLLRKVAEGVDCRILYDDVGSGIFVNKAFQKQLNSEGIKCNVFNPALPFLSIFMNNRDHRKITVIDGIYGYTGGYNLADEYFNIISPYGYWKDNGIRLKGPAVNSLEAMFIEMWNFSELRTDDVAKLNFENRYPWKTESKGFVAPYADSPIDNDPMGENVYINILGNSVDYCWFMSPYLVLSDELKRAISLAAKRGVDVRIITPGIPDKRTVFGVTRSYYNLLAKSGARIYEFTPGFNHCKLCLSDDDTCVVGTINLDYRSLFHHFENGVLLYKVDAIADVKKDFINTFEASEEVTEKAKQKPNLFMRFIRSLLRLIAPLL